MTHLASVTVISPHLDDGVMSCGQMIAAVDQTTILTVLSRAPQGRLLTDYDRGCGFSSSREAVRSRQLEDREACKRLSARQRLGGILDGQYQPVNVDDVREALSALTGDVVAPLGLRHPDHVAVSDAALNIYRDDVRLWLYEELPYRVLVPEAVPERLDALARRGVLLEQDNLPAGALESKQDAARCYRSQTHDLGDLGVEHCWLVPERYWRVVVR